MTNNLSGMGFEIQFVIRFEYAEGWSPVAIKAFRE